MEEDICFAVMSSLVSRDPFLQIWRSRCWVSCAGAVFCAFGRSKGWEWAPIHTILNDNTCNYFPIIKGWICFHTNVNYHMKTRQESFKLFEEPPGSTAWGHLGWIQITLHKSLNWSKTVIVWHSDCCFPSKCRAPLKNKAKILLMKPPVSGLHVRILQ